jgi:hypothetical protein
MSSNINEPIRDEFPQESLAPLTDHPDNLSTVIQISPTECSSPESFADDVEEQFIELCKRLKTPVQIIPKTEMIWNRREPLRFFQSLAFVLRSESYPDIAVSSFVDTQGATKLYVASNQSMTVTEQKEITEIIDLFLEMSTATEIDAKVLPRQLSYIIKQFRKGAPLVDDFIKDFPGDLANLIEDLMFKRRLSLDDMYPLLKLIWGKRKDLRLMKAGTSANATEETRRMAFHLCKMVRIFEEINFVMKKVKNHQEDASLKSLTKPFHFIENKNKCHAEIALLNTAVEHGASKTLYIGVSKRPCYTCSLFFKAIEEFQSVNFKISMVTTSGKLYGNWNKIDGFMAKEFNLVWASVVEKRDMIHNSHTKIDNNDNSSCSGSSSDEYDSIFDR